MPKLNLWNKAKSSGTQAAKNMGAPSQRRSKKAHAGVPLTGKMPPKMK